MAIFNPIAQKEQEEGIPSLIMAIYQKYQRAGETRRERKEARPQSVCYVRDQNVVVVKPPIMRASKTRALMAAVCLQGGLLHTTVLQKQRQIYKTTIRKREKINQNAIKVE